MRHTDRLHHKLFNGPRRIFRKLFLVIGALWVLSLSGCAGAGQIRSIMDCVPADAVSVKTVDLNLLFREAGVPTPVRGGELLEDASRVLSLVAEPDFHEVLTLVLASPGAVDVSKVVGFTSSSGRDVLVMPVMDEGLVSRIIEEAPGEGDVNQTDGLTFRIINGTTLATDGRGLCFIAQDIMTISSTLADAHCYHFGEFDGVRQFLSRKAAANIVINCGNSPLSYLGGTARWLCVSFNVTRQSVSATGVVMNRDGVLDPIGENFEEIDTDFLRYTPPDASVVIAFGKFSGNDRGLGMLLGRFAPMYLPQADGTTSLYALPASGTPEAVAMQHPGSWNVETMVHLPEDLIEVGLGQYVSRAKGEVSPVGPDQWMYSSDGDEYFFGAFDGSLVFSTNREISSAYNNSFTDDFLGKRAAMVVDIPSGGVLAHAWRLPYGLTLKIGLEAMSFNARVSFNGTGMTALRALLHLPQLPDLFSRYNNMVGL